MSSVQNDKKMDRVTKIILGVLFIVLIYAFLKVVNLNTDLTTKAFFVIVFLMFGIITALKGNKTRKSIKEFLDFLKGLL